jgi:DNA-binding FrmR family transcriptional regulator
MTSIKQKNNIQGRLNRIVGQVNGVKKMIDDDRYCVDILTQTAAIISALRSVESIVMENHMNTCVADAMRSRNPEEQREKVEEVMAVIGRYGRNG